MGLNKDVCKACRKKNDGKKTKGFVYKGWTAFDGLLWNQEKMVRCPPKYNSDYVRISIYDEPPDWCPFKTEHYILKEK